MAAAPARLCPRTVIFGVFHAGDGADGVAERLEGAPVRAPLGGDLHAPVRLRAGHLRELAVQGLGSAVAVRQRVLQASRAAHDEEDVAGVDALGEA